MDRLRKSQKEALLTWVAEGLLTDEINKRAAQFKPRFKVSNRVVTYYRKSRGVALEEIKENSEASALKTGFAIKEARVAALQKLADKMLDELTRDEGNRLWTEQVKGVGSQDNFERYEYEEFNKAEVDALRGVLDDIASELGERQPGTQINNNFNFDMEGWKKTRSDRKKKVEAIPEMD